MNGESGTRGVQSGHGDAIGYVVARARYGRVVWRPCRPPGRPGTVTSMDPGSGDSMGVDAASVEFMPLETEALVRWSQEARARARATREQIRRAGHSGTDCTTW